MASDGDAIGATELSPAILSRWNRRPSAPPSAPAATVPIALNQTMAAAVDELEQRFIEHALVASDGRVADAAQLLGLSRKGLFLKRRRQGLLRKKTGA